MIEQIILIAAGSIGGGLGGWIFGRRKNTAEAVHNELGNTSSIISMWEKKADALFKGNIRMLEKMQELMSEVTQLRIENQTLKINQNNTTVLLEGIKQENEALKMQLDDLKITLQQQQKENRELMIKLKNMNVKRTNTKKNENFG